MTVNGNPPSANLRYTYTATLVGADLLIKVTITDNYNGHAFALALSYCDRYPVPAGSVDLVRLVVMQAPWTSPTMTVFYEHPVLSTATAGSASLSTSSKSALTVPTGPAVCQWELLRDGVTRGVVGGWGVPSLGPSGTTPTYAFMYGDLVKSLA